MHGINNSFVGRDASQQMVRPTGFTDMSAGKRLFHILFHKQQ